MQVYEMLPLNTLAEIINNTIYISLAPSFEHQRIITHLWKLTDEYRSANKIGVAVVCPVDVFLDEKNIVQPAIVYLSNNSLEK